MMYFLYSRRTHTHTGEIDVSFFVAGPPGTDLTLFSFQTLGSLGAQWNRRGFMQVLDNVHILPHYLYNQ